MILAWFELLFNKLFIKFNKLKLKIPFKKVLLGLNTVLIWSVANTVVKI